MLLPDVHVLVYALRAESPDHERYAEWLRALAGGAEPFALSELGASRFVRIVTNPKVWDEPTTIEDALRFIENMRTRSNARVLTHGSASWTIFAQLCVSAKARGKTRCRRISRRARAWLRVGDCGQRLRTFPWVALASSAGWVNIVAQSAIHRTMRRRARRRPAQCLTLHAARFSCRMNGVAWNHPSPDRCAR